MHVLFWLVLWVAAAILAAAISSRLDRFRPAGCLPVLVLGPFSLLLMAAGPANHVAYERQPPPRHRGELKTCRHCTRLVRVEARVCRYCGQDLPQDR